MGCLFLKGSSSGGLPFARSSIGVSSLGGLCLEDSSLAAASAVAVASTVDVEAEEEEKEQPAPYTIDGCCGSVLRAALGGVGEAE